MAASRRPRSRSGRQRGTVVGAAGEDDFLLCQVAKGMRTERVPVWLFRQAGRHLPEYMDYKKQRGKNFLQLLQDPQDVAEVTMQPLRRYPVDAAILFSDILVVAEALGINVEMPGGKGILVTDPLETAADLRRLPSVDKAGTAAFVEERLSHVLEAVTAILARMTTEGFGSKPLLGFSAAPWTLFFYMVGGSSRKNVDAGERWLETEEAACKELFELLTRVIIEYLSAQARAGCHALQVFEAMGDKLSPENYRRWALPAMSEIAKELRQRHPGVPLMVFPRGACDSVAELQTAGYDVVTADCSTDLGGAARDLQAEASGQGRAARVATLQGNFDPKWLRPDDGGSVEAVQREVQAMMESLSSGVDESRGPGLIANLGEGLSGKESPELVAAFVEAIHSSRPPW